MFRQPLLTAVSAGLLLLQTVPAFAQGYIDASAYTDAVMALTSTGVIDGGGSVRLDDYVNRAEALKIILKSQKRYAPAIQKMQSSLPPQPLFTDVSQQEWYAPYLEVGFKYGLVKGYPDGRFWPNGGVRVAEAAAMLVRSYGDKTSSFVTSAELPNTEGQWFTDALSVINSQKAVLPGSRLNPGAYMTRGQLFDMVYRMQVAKSGGRPVADTLQAPVISVTGQDARVEQPQQMVHASMQFASKKEFAITIPSLGIVDLTITHPQDPFTQKGVLAVLQDGVGHLFSYPGQGGKIMVYGHSSGYPWDLSKFTKIFRTINQMQTGDRIYVTYKGTLYVYQVTSKKTIPAKDQTAFEPDENGEELVLYTCWPPDSITNRYLVYAAPVEKVALK
jgi:LPXTG-site transpeptidase (sortase) family protein